MKNVLWKVAGTVLQARKVNLHLYNIYNSYDSFYDPETLNGNNQFYTIWKVKLQVKYNGFLYNI